MSEILIKPPNLTYQQIFSRMEAPGRFLLEAWVDAEPASPFHPLPALLTPVSSLRLPRVGAGGREVSRGPTAAGCVLSGLFRGSLAILALPGRRHTPVSS